MNDFDTATHRLLHAKADIAYNLHCFGDHLATREGYRTHKGTDAVRYFLMVTHGWTPATVRALSDDDLEFAMAEEMAGWTLPKAQRP
jgi:hypothetical protein